MLAMADQTGLVPATAPGISTASFIPLETTRKSIAILESPDPDSKSMDNEGRRIKRVEGGYFILNYEKYRTFSYSLKKDAIRKREYRTKVKGTTRDIKRDIVPKCPGHSASVYASEVLSYLNSKTGRKYKNFKNIIPRLQEGHTVDELKAIIDTKAQDPYFIEHPHYMNPETLFRPGNFDRYINQKPQDFHGKPTTHERRWGGVENRPDETPARALTPEEERAEKIHDLMDSIKNAQTFLSKPEAQKDKKAIGIVAGNLERFTRELASLQAEGGV
jgi:uncharacterized phage protein (TIGR02220 family)